MSVAWVVGGYNSSLQAKLIYSTDGITWSNSSSATSIFGSYILAITHNGTIWVAGGQSGSTGILGYSYDGITWYKSTSGSSILFAAVYGVAYGNGMFIAVGSGGTYSIAYSTDGINWTGAANNQFASIPGSCITYANNTWVMGFYNGNGIAYSSNGMTWTLASTPVLNGAVIGIAYKGGTWVAVGYNSANNVFIAYSTNLSTWTAATGASASFGNTGRGIITDGSRFVAVGQDNSGLVKFKTSTDGMTWTNYTPTNCTNMMYAISYNPNATSIKWLIAQDSATSSVLYSSDSSTWSTTNASTHLTVARAIASAVPQVIGTAPTINSITTTGNTFNINFTPGTGGIPAPTTYYYSLNGGASYTDASSTTSPILIPGIVTGDYYNVALIAKNAAGNTVASNVVVASIPYPCFLEGSKILCLNQETDQEVYIPVETLREGDLVKTSMNGYKAIFHIGRKTIENPADDPNPRNRLYRFPKSQIPYMTEDLCITGEHCTLHRKLSPTYEETVRNHMGDIYITEYQYRVPACIDKRATAYEGEGPATIWHFALENHNIYHNYGVWANGLLVESCSIQYLTELADMELV